VVVVGRVVVVVLVVVVVVVGVVVVLVVVVGLLAVVVGAVSVADVRVGGGGGWAVPDTVVVGAAVSVAEACASTRSASVVPGAATVGVGAFSATSTSSPERTGTLSSVTRDATLETAAHAVDVVSAQATTHAMIKGFRDRTRDIFHPCRSTAKRTGTQVFLKFGSIGPGMLPTGGHLSRLKAYAR
jgi:hypothetical protein